MAGCIRPSKEKLKTYVKNDYETKRYFNNNPFYHSVHDIKEIKE